MNPQSTVPPVTPQPTSVPQPVVSPVALVQTGSKALAIWALVLAILSLLSGVVFFVSLVLGIAAVVMAIIALVKRKPGKGASIAAVIIGGIALLLVPLWALITLTAYNGITERANEANSSTVETFEQ